MIQVEFGLTFVVLRIANGAVSFPILTECRFSGSDCFQQAHEIVP